MEGFLEKLDLQWVWLVSLAVWFEALVTLVPLAMVRKIWAALLAGGMQGRGAVEKALGAEWIFRK